MSERNAERPASAVIWSWQAEVQGESGAAARAARRRGLLRGGLGLGVAAGLLLWKPVLGLVGGSIALVLLAMALGSPGGLYPRIEHALAAFAHAVGVAVSWTALTFVFFLVVLPAGVFLRATGRLRLERALDPDRASYWRPPDTAGPAPGRHDRQF